MSILLFRVSILLFRVSILLFHVTILLFRLSILLFRVSILLFRVSILLFRVSIFANNNPHTAFIVFTSLQTKVTELSEIQGTLAVLRLSANLQVWNLQGSS